MKCWKTIGKPINLGPLETKNRSAVVFRDEKATPLLGACVQWHLDPAFGNLHRLGVWEISFVLWRKGSSHVFCAPSCNFPSLGLYGFHVQCSCGENGQLERVCKNGWKITLSMRILGSLIPNTNMLSMMFRDVPKLTMQNHENGQEDATGGDLWRQSWWCCCSWWWWWWWVMINRAKISRQHFWWWWWWFCTFGLRIQEEPFP